MIRYRAETKDVAAYGALAEWHHHARTLHRPSRELLGHLVGERLQRRPGAAVNHHLGVQAHGNLRPGRRAPPGGSGCWARGPGARVGCAGELRMTCQIPSVTSAYALAAGLLGEAAITGVPVSDASATRTVYGMWGWKTRMPGIRSRAPMRSRLKTVRWWTNVGTRPSSSSSGLSCSWAWRMAWASWRSPVRAKPDTWSGISTQRDAAKPLTVRNPRLGGRSNRITSKAWASGCWTRSRRMKSLPPLSTSSCSAANSSMCAGTRLTPLKRVGRMARDTASSWRDIRW